MPCKQNLKHSEITMNFLDFLMQRVWFWWLLMRKSMDPNVKECQRFSKLIEIYPDRVEHMFSAFSAFQLSSTTQLKNSRRSPSGQPLSECRPQGMESISNHWRSRSSHIFRPETESNSTRRLRYNFTRLGNDNAPSSGLYGDSQWRASWSPEMWHSPAAQQRPQGTQTSCGMAWRHGEENRRIFRNNVKL